MQIWAYQLAAHEGTCLCTSEPLLDLTSPSTELYINPIRCMQCEVREAGIFLIARRQVDRVQRAHETARRTLYSPQVETLATVLVSIESPDQPVDLVSERHG